MRGVLLMAVVNVPQSFVWPMLRVLNIVLVPPVQMVYVVHSAVMIVSGVMGQKRAVVTLVIMMPGQVSAIELRVPVKISVVIVVATWPYE